MNSDDKVTLAEAIRRKRREIMAFQISRGKCADCGIYDTDPPSAYCLGCKACREYQIRHQAFPYAYKPDIKDQHLRVAIDRHGSFVLLDLGGFLTFVESASELSIILQQERENPGALREMITGKNNIREAREREERHHKEFPRDEPKALNINLDDLELTI